MGRDRELENLDLNDAYRIVPVSPLDYHVMGISWKGQTYVDRALPLGLQSSPKTFNAVADNITWVLSCQGIMHQLHYLGDFFFLGEPKSQQELGTY